MDQRASRYALFFIFVTMLIDTIGLGIIIPVTPRIIVALRGGTVSEAAPYGGWLFDAFLVMQFLCAPLIGNLSDRFGRRPVLIASLVALGIDYTITGLAPTIGWLFAGRLLSGMAGAAYPTVNAYIADVSPPEKRAANFGLVNAAFGLGFVLGPAVGGLLGTYGPRIPFFVSAGLAFANALFGWFVLAESLPREMRRTFTLSRANPLGSLLALRRFPLIGGLIAVFVLARFGHDSNPSVWSYYTMLKFHWTPRDVGLGLATVGIVMALISAFLTRFLVPRIGEARAVMAGLFLGGAGFAGYAFATAGWMMFPFIALNGLMGLAMPALNATISRQVSPDEQGELQGALSSIGSLTSLAGVPTMAYLFAWFTSPRAPVYFPGAPFLTAAIAFWLSAIVFTRVRSTRASKSAGTA
jgi:DHA1 family tetracycline resistance protein-like MFS transporter